MYLESLNEEIKQYFKILSPEFPEWLNEYIETPEMQRIGKISMSCGTDYSNVFNLKYFHSNLDHSVGVALIVWNFTKDKKQTLAGLFHDIATPCFKHCIDFLHGDHEKQESTEERTADILKNSKEIVKLLKRDGIRLDEVDDYHIYPIADNDTPQLSSDRFEYTFASGLVFFRVWNLDDIKECYNNVTILKNENGIDEIGFKNKKVCEKYIHIISRLWPEWISNKDKVVMQFIADTMKIMENRGYINIDELYEKSEQDIIDKIINCKDKYISEGFKKFQIAKKVYDSDLPVNGKYCVSVKAKRRYVIPLVCDNNRVNRIINVSNKAKKDIEAYLNSENAPYGYFDFEFKIN